MRTYAIGDIHGQLDLLKAAHDRIAADQARHGAAPIVYIGDLVDRGPDSPGVIEYLMAGHARGEDWVTLLGNHDRMFAGYLRDLHWRDPRLRVDLSYLHPKIGGAVTLSNYGVKNPADRRAIGEIAYARGFTDQAQFSRAFRARFGLSPSEARGRA